MVFTRWSRCPPPHPTCPESEEFPAAHLSSHPLLQVRPGLNLPCQEAEQSSPLHCQEDERRSPLHCEKRKRKLTVAWTSSKRKLKFYHILTNIYTYSHIRRSLPLKYKTLHLIPSKFPNTVYVHIVQCCRSAMFCCRSESGSDFLFCFAGSGSNFGSRSYPKNRGIPILLRVILLLPEIADILGVLCQRKLTIRNDVLWSCKSI